MGWREKSVFGIFWKVLLVVSAVLNRTGALGSDVDHRSSGSQRHRHRHAYAGMMYMGTPRDYEFYVALRVMMRSLSQLKVEADRVVIASADVPLLWVRAL